MADTPDNPRSFKYDEKLRQLVGLRNDPEDWSGKTSPAERRKLQNRLNQRAHRKRSKAKQIRIGAIGDSMPGHFLIESVTGSDHESASNKVALRPVTSSIRYPECLIKGGDRAMEAFAVHAYGRYVQGAPVLTDLPMLLQLNVISGLACNAQLLDVAADWLLYEATSPFNKQGPGLGTFTAGSAGSWPPSMFPTALQCSVEHHPWIDLFPSPRLRDNILQAIEQPEICDEDELCHDLCNYGDPAKKPTLIIWGDAWNPRNWEASTAFLEKWGWLLDGCPEIIEATNYWRGRRGEKLLSYTELIAIVRRSVPLPIRA